MISKEEVKHIADLSRLELTENEIEKMQKDLSGILDYFDLLKKAPKVKKIDLKILGTGAREDEILPRDASVTERIIAGVPDKKDGYIKVKSVL